MNKREKLIISKALSAAFKDYCNERRRLKEHLERDKPRFPFLRDKYLEARGRFEALQDLAIKMGITSAAYLSGIESMIEAECELENYKALR